MTKKLELSLIGVGFTFWETDNNWHYWAFHDFPDEVLFPTRENAIESATNQAGKFLHDSGIFEVEKWESLTAKDKATMLRLHAHQFAFGYQFGQFGQEK